MLWENFKNIQSLWSKDQERTGIRLSSCARRVENAQKLILWVKENENTDRCGRGRRYSSDNQRKKHGSQQKKLCKEHFQVGQATSEKQDPGTGMHRNE